MTPPSDELRHLWECDRGEPQVEQAALDFDRKIRFRDFREMGAGVVVAAVFLWFAIHDSTALERAAHLSLALCGVWIGCYMRLYAKASRKPDPGQTLESYRQEFLERYDRQIRLLRNAKYWYILPFWLGLMFSAFAYLSRTGDVVRFGLMAAFVTALNASLWWLNEVVGVRWLQSQKRRSAALMGASE